ncbi:MAG: hypothetical protein R3274_05170 [Desulfobacterales bacterium]|nr:hypothetical protein [Desulfobacterales bacterium]
MKIKSIISLFSCVLLFFVIGVLGNSLPLSAASPANSDVVLLGIMDPDDRRHIWALPADAAADINRQLAAKYPRKLIDGVTFYRVRSWRDTAHLVIEAHAQQGLLIVDLIEQVERLRRNGTDRKLTRRVTALEKRLNQALDPGNR